jgi:hypothetical protein
MKTRSIIRNAFLALAVTATFGALAPEAEACGGGWWPEVEVDYRVQGVARAEKQLEEGDYLAAAGSVLRMIPHIRSYKGVTRDEIINRSMRVLAVATARSNGKLDLAKEIPIEMHDAWLGDDDEGRVANLEWSVRALRAVADTKADDLVIETQLAEAMAQLDNERGQAHGMLEVLAGKDLITSAEAYKALAELRGMDGDSDGRTAALDRCKAMAKDAAMCEAPHAS